LTRSFVERSSSKPTPEDNLWFRAWAGSKVEPQGGGVFLADGKVKLRFEVPDGGQPLVRQSGSGAELLVPISIRRPKKPGS